MTIGPCHTEKSRRKYVLNVLRIGRAKETVGAWKPVAPFEADSQSMIKVLAVIPTRLESSARRTQITEPSAKLVFDEGTES